MSDFQIHELYLAPAADRAAEFDRRAKPGSGSGEPDDPDGVPDKAVFIAAMEAEFGPNPEYAVAWEKMYGADKPVSS